MRNYTGCSGFSYDHWMGNFYPDDLPKARRLEFYSQKFDTVEINSSFYHLPKQKTLENWYERVPGNFRFTLKGSRFVTHQKKLNNVEEPVNKFYELASVLGGKLGCILWQLPGNQHKDLEKLDRFCQTLSNEFNNVIEFRHRSWYDEEVYEVLKNYGVICCLVAAPDHLTTEPVKTADKVYMRFHGKYEWYREWFSDEDLEDWANKILGLNPAQVYSYFNNDYEGNAPKNAQTFSRLINR